MMLSAAPQSKRRVNMFVGTLERVALFWPLPLFSTFTMMAGSSPALAPTRSASHAIARLVAEIMLLTSFIVCATPGWLDTSITSDEYA